MGLLYIHRMPEIQYWAEHTEPDMNYRHNTYPCKIIGATIRAEALLARLLPAHKEQGDAHRPQRRAVPDRPEPPRRRSARLLSAYLLQGSDRLQTHREPEQDDDDGGRFGRPRLPGSLRPDGRQGLLRSCARHRRPPTCGCSAKTVRCRSRSISSPANRSTTPAPCCTPCCVISSVSKPTTAWKPTPKRRPKASGGCATWRSAIST